MCAMIQKLRMNFGSIRVCYRLQFFASWVIDGGLPLRGREATRRSKPCRVIIQFATTHSAAQPVRLVTFQGSCACRGLLVCAPSSSPRRVFSRRPLPCYILHHRIAGVLPALSWRYIVERGRLYLALRTTWHNIF